MTLSVLTDNIWSNRPASVADVVLYNSMAIITGLHQQSTCCHKEDHCHSPL